MVESLARGFLLPSAICVALPVLIVWLVTRTKMNNDNKRTEIIIKAIEANNSIDVDALAKSLEKSRKTLDEIQQGRLLKGCCFSLSGLAFIVCGLCVHFNDMIEEDGFLGLLITGLIALSIGIGFLIVYFSVRGKKV